MWEKNRDESDWFIGTLPYEHFCQNRLEERGIITEKTEMSSVLRGVRKGCKAGKHHQDFLKILDDYESKMGVCEWVLR